MTKMEQVEELINEFDGMDLASVLRIVGDRLDEIGLETFGERSGQLACALYEQMEQGGDINE